MDLKISFLSVIRVISFRKCFFTQVLNLCIRGGQLFNISNRFYITLDTVLSINLIKWYLKDCLHVIRIRSSCRKCDSCLSYIDGVKFYVPIGITKLLSLWSCFSFLLMSLYYHLLSYLSILFRVFFVLFLFYFGTSRCISVFFTNYCNYSEYLFI